MLLNVLAVGDVVGESGLGFLTRQLPELKRRLDVHFTVVNGENASLNGVLPEQVQAMYAAGADVVTLGNHTWGRGQIVRQMEDDPYLLRPANYAGSELPGRGLGVYDGPRGLRIAVMQLMGRVDLDPNLDNPFRRADTLLAGCQADVVLCDFHAEATSEKGAFARYLDGRVQAVWGTHTHVPTADAQVLPGGTGFVTDLGMTGPVRSVLGIRPEDSINLFLGGMPRRYQLADGLCKLEACLFTVDTDARRCVRAERADVREEKKGAAPC